MIRKFGTVSGMDGQVLGIDLGASAGLNTSGATATAADITLALTAYANGVKLTGTGVNAKRTAFGNVNASSSLVSFGGLAFTPIIVIVYLTTPGSIFRYEINILSAGFPFHNGTSTVPGYVFGEYYQSGAFALIPQTSTNIVSGGVSGLSVRQTTANYTWIAYE
jgi:hypothetical protein